MRCPAMRRASCRASRWTPSKPTSCARRDRAAMTAIPLLQGYGAESVLAHREHRPVRIDEFLRHVSQLAAQLPERRHVLNRCADRYRFAVGFAAALLRGQVSLLPPNETPDLIAQLVAQYPDLYCLSDAAGGPARLHTLAFPQLTGAGSASPRVPTVRANQIAA